MKPVKNVKLGGIEVAVWENSSKEGKKFFTTTIDRNYKVGEDWKKTNSLRDNDLPKAILALQEAYHFVSLKEE
ncbi:MAG: hypothetical protein PHY04_01060 [Candidatus ainarchaeum sp.]|jgi:hypothetical protein|nr:hypothetical protein [Candidatus ainarchaeum sp.]MDD3085673.1 hypothetical protein [Candidatus ainarchaeum sp.]MDD4128306.1 hypothetical protein [Candidatus ainarchaeum sp.]HPM86057.1 hypothetical protein [archaeon]